jgi:hypothetical protein
LIDALKLVKAYKGITKAQTNFKLKEKLLAEEISECSQLCLFKFERG